MSDLLNNIADFLQRHDDETQYPLWADTSDTVALATAVLLIELARQDADYDADERTFIATQLRHYFNLAPRDAAALMAQAESTESAEPDNFPYREKIRQSFSATEKQAVAVMLWRVAFADGTLAQREAELIQRIGQTIGLKDEDIRAARREAEDSLT